MNDVDLTIEYIDIQSNDLTIINNECQQIIVNTDEDITLSIDNIDTSEIEIALAGPPGPQGIQGPQGIPGTKTTFVFNQSLPANVWVINHNMNCYPTCTVFDSANSLILADYYHANTNTLICNFLVAFSGVAYIN